MGTIVPRKITMTRDEYREVIRLASLSQADLSRMVRIEPQKLNDTLSGRRRWERYEDAICKIIAMRSRAILARLAEYGHGDK